MSDAISREAALAELKRHAKGATTIGGQTFRTIQLGEATDAIAALPAVTPGVKVKPTDAQIASACMSYRHDFGLLDAEERQKVMLQARFWLEAWQKEIDLTPQPAPDVARLVEEAQQVEQAYEQWVRCVTGTPEDTIAGGALFARVGRLRAALAAMEGKP